MAIVPKHVGKEHGAKQEQKISKNNLEELAVAGRFCSNPVTPIPAKVAIRFYKVTCVLPTCLKDNILVLD